MSFVSAGKDKSLRQHRGSMSTMGVVGTLVLVLILLAEQTQQQVQKLQLEEHVSVKAYHARTAGVAHAAGQLQYVLHDKLEALETGDIHLVVNLALGKNKQPLKLVLDTGSYNLWILRKDCGGTGADTLGDDCANAKSPITLGYADGIATGYSGHTAVWLEGATVMSQNHYFAVIDSVNFKINYGILGLAKGTLKPEESFLPRLKRQGLIKEEAFSIAKRDNGLFLALGGIDPSWVNPQATQATVTINSQSAYYIDVDKVTFGSETIITSTTPALVDSGNSLLSFPWGYKDTLISVFKKSGLDCQLRQEANRRYYQLYCQFEKDRTPQVPDLQLGLGGKMFKIPFSHLPMRGKFCQEVIPAFADFDSDGPSKELCPLRIEFESMASNLIIGQVFIQQNYVTFDLEKRTITFIQ